MSNEKCRCIEVARATQVIIDGKCSYSLTCHTCGTSYEVRHGLASGVKTYYPSFNPEVFAALKRDALADADY